jgi:ribonuclease P/MRP protein subunit RPP1
VRRFVDLNVRDPGDPRALTEMLDLASKLGFKGIALASESPASEALRNEGRILGIDIASRIDLRLRNPNELSKALRRVRRKFEILAVHCENKAVSRQAAKDHRVDILTFNPLNTGRRREGLDRQGASLASRSNCAYEVSISDLLESSSKRARALVNLKRDIWNATNEGVPVVVSSGAWAPLLMREPRALASVTSLLGLSENQGLDSVSETPQRILARNREKLAPGFVSPGVKEPR